MPQDFSKAAALKNSTPTPSTSQQPPSTEETTALTALTQTAAGTIRQSIGTMTQLAENLEDQRDMVTDHAADRVAAILDPQSIQAEIAVKTLNKLEGKAFIPFELEPIELPKVRRYVPQLPQSYAAVALPSSSTSSSPIDASKNETNGSLNAKTAPGTGFGKRDKD